MNQSRKIKILIAEDDPLNMKLFRDLLEVKNFDVICVTDGNKVISQMVKYKPNLVLMDIRLNDVSGLDIIEDIKENPEISDIPVIALTAFAMKNDKERMLSSGFKYYMPKPISIDNFFEVINKFVPVSA